MNMGISTEQIAQRTWMTFFIPLRRYSCNSRCFLTASPADLPSSMELIPGGSSPLAGIGGNVRGHLVPGLAFKVSRNLLTFSGILSRFFPFCCAEFCTSESAFLGCAEICTPFARKLASCCDQGAPGVPPKLSAEFCTMSFLALCRRSGSQGQEKRLPQKARRAKKS